VPVQFDVVAARFFEAREEKQIRRFAQDAMSF
jgi:hypothetical protein